jgi:hypothetical protein
LRSQSRSAVGWILAPALIAALWLPGSAAAAPKTGQSPHCKRYCMTVEPREGPEGSVFRISGRAWRPNRPVQVIYGVYCPPGAVCISIAYFARVRTDRHGRFTFRVRAGEAKAGDDDRKIHAGGDFEFSQRTASHRTITRKPRYVVILPECGDCG